MKVIHVFSNQSRFFLKKPVKRVPFAQEYAMNKGLRENGAWVYHYDTEAHYDALKNSYKTLFKSQVIKKMASYLEFLIRDLEPDLLFISQHDFPVELVGVLQKIKQSRGLNLKIAFWYVDAIHPTLPDCQIRVQATEAILEVCDHYFVTSDPNYLADLSDRIKSLEDKLHFFPYMHNGALFRECGVEGSSGSPRQNDVIFCARPSPFRKPYEQALRELGQSHRVALYGQEKMLLSWDYIRELQNSKIGINLSRFSEIPYYASDRLIHILSSGSLLLSHRGDKLDRLYRPDREAVYFDGPKELKEKVEYYLAHEEERLQIASQGLLLAQTQYNAKRVMGYMLSVLSDRVSDWWSYDEN